MEHDAPSGAPTAPPLLRWLLFLVLLASVAERTAFTLRIGATTLDVSSAELAIAIFFAAALPWVRQNFRRMAWATHRSLFVASTLFVAAGFISAVASDYRGAALKGSIRILSLYVEFWTMMCLPLDGILDRLPRWLVGISLVQVAIGVCEVLAPAATQSLMFAVFEKSNWLREGPMPRIGGTLWHPNLLAWFLATGLAAIFMLDRDRARPAWRLPAAAVIVVGLVLTQAQLGWFAPLILMALMAMTSPRRGAMVATLALPAVLALALPLWLTPMRVGYFFTDVRHVGADRIESTHGAGSVSGRLNLWGVAWDAFVDRPVVGAGPLCFSWWAADHVSPGSPHAWLKTTAGEHNAHSLYLEILAGHGIVGSFAALAVAMIFLRALFRGGVTPEAWLIVFAMLFQVFESSIMVNAFNLVFAMAAALALRRKIPDGG